MSEGGRVGGILRGPLARIAQGEISPPMLRAMGDCIIKGLAKDSKDYFAKRGWSGKDPMGGPDIWKSFKWRIRGKDTLEITSTFYGMSELAYGDIPSRRMTWLTQENKERHPNEFKLSPRDKKLRMKRGGSIDRGTRLLLVVPVRTKGGSIEFRMAPLKTADAWIHPGIARFTFFEASLRKLRQRCAVVIIKALADTLKGSR